MTNDELIDIIQPLTLHPDEDVRLAAENLITALMDSEND